MPDVGVVYLGSIPNIFLAEVKGLMERCKTSGKDTDPKETGYW